MSQTDGLRRYFEAALALTQITRSRAEEVVRELIHTGELESNRAQDWVEDLVRNSRQRSEAFVSTVRSEVRRQIDELGLNDVNDLARRVAEVLDKAETAARRATSGAGRRTGRARAAGRRATGAAKASTATRASGAKKAASKRASGATKKASAARKTAAKKTTSARKTAAKKTTAARKTAAKKTTSARKTAAKKTTAASRRRT